MGSTGVFLTGLVVGVLSSSTYIMYADLSVGNSYESGFVFQQALTEKVNNIEKKIDMLFTQGSDLLVNHNSAASIVEEACLSSNVPVQKAQTVPPDQENRLNSAREIISNEIASNEFDLMLFYVDDKNYELTDVEKKLIISELIQEVNNGQLHIKNVLR
ncbi:MAG: hypothetical protein OEY89_05660 [Gammaproteobacteria bacterium]|nr:hypothetical protein [Gammaproteobacteria bacterium]